MTKISAIFTCNAQELLNMPLRKLGINMPKIGAIITEVPRTVLKIGHQDPKTGHMPKNGAKITEVPRTVPKIEPIVCDTSTGLQKSAKKPSSNASRLAR